MDNLFIILEVLLISLEPITLTIIQGKNSWKVQESMFLMEPQQLNTALEEMRHWAQSAASINVAAGATLDFTGSSTGRGFIYLDNTPTFTINNNGTLKLNMAGASSNNFYSNETVIALSIEVLMAVAFMMIYLILNREKTSS